MVPPKAEGVGAPKAEGGLLKPAPKRDGLLAVEVAVPKAPVPEEAGGVLDPPPKAFPADCCVIPNPDCCCPKADVPPVPPPS